MRLTLVIGKVGSGGAQRALTVLANAWAARGHAVTLLTHDYSEEGPFYPLDSRVRYQPLGLVPRPANLLARVLFSARKITRIRAALRGDRPDAVIAFTYPVNVVCLAAALGTGIPLVISERVDPGGKLGMKRVWKILRYVLYPRAACLVVQTERIAGRFRPRMNGRLAVIPNPVLVPPPGNGGDVFSVGKRTVVSLGRLDAQKGFDLLLRAFASLNAVSSGWDLAIFGDGPELETLKALTRDLGIEGRVRFPGKVKDPYPVLKAAGIFVLSSRYEGFPNALGEAMASGLPVIATDCPTGPREIITDGVDGLLVPNEDVKGLSGALERLMADEGLRGRLGAQAVAIVQRFGLGGVVDRWETVLRDKAGVNL